MRDEDGVPAVAGERAELRRLLATGPFADALRCAIRVRGLGLDRVQHRLRERGVQVSLATLSYWQSGQRQPERDSSLAAVRELEAVLKLPADSLSGLLGPPRPRGRWSQRQVVPIERLWPRPEPIADAASGVAGHTETEEALSRLSIHARVRVDADGRGRQITRRDVLRAEQDGIDHVVFIFALDEHGCSPGRVQPVSRCRLGQLVTRPEDGVIAAELMFDHPLARGETTVIEYALVSPPPYPPATHYHIRLNKRVREVVMEAEFDPTHVPTWCAQHTRPLGEEERTRPLAVDGAHSIHAVGLDFGPGVFGISWGWEPAGSASPPDHRSVRRGVPTGDSRRQ